MRGWHPTHYAIVVWQSRAVRGHLGRRLRFGLRFRKRRVSNVLTWATRLRRRATRARRTGTMRCPRRASSSAGAQPRLGTTMEL